jgi:hypothetical protein
VINFDPKHESADKLAVTRQIEVVQPGVDSVGERL